MIDWGELIAIGAGEESAARARLELPDHVGDGEGHAVAFVLLPSVVEALGGRRSWSFLINLPRPVDVGDGIGNEGNVFEFH